MLESSLFFTLFTQHCFYGLKGGRRRRGRKEQWKGGRKGGRDLEARSKPRLTRGDPQALKQQTALQSQTGWKLLSLIRMGILSRQT